MTSFTVSVRSNFRVALLPALLTAGSLLAALAITLAPPATGPVAAVFPPWWSIARSMMAASAAGSVVRFGAPFVIVVVPDTANATNLLRHNGAWLVLDPHALSGCSAQPRQIGTLNDG